MKSINNKSEIVTPITREIKKHIYFIISIYTECRTIIYLFFKYLRLAVRPIKENVFSDFSYVLNYNENRLNE